MADPTSPAPRRSLRQRASKAQLAPEADEPVKTSTRKRSTAKLRAEPSEAEAAGTLHTPANGSADPDGAKKPVGESDVHEVYEFGGPLGTLAMMIFFPGLLYYLWICLWFYDGQFIVPKSLAVTPDWFRMMGGYVKTVCSLIFTAFGIYGGLMAFQLFLAAIMPGYKQEGLEIASLGGRRLMYNCNALLSWYTTLITAATLHFSGIFPLTILIDRFGEIMTVAQISGFVLAAACYAHAVYAGTAIRMSGNIIYDYFMGAALNPRIGPVDIKMWAEVRIPWVLLFLYSLAGAAKQHEIHGYVSPNQALMILGTGLYINACAKGEELIPQTWDMAYEKFGWLLSYWNLAGVPFTYCYSIIYMATRDPATYRFPLWANIALYVTLLCAYFVFDTSMAQKSRFKIDMGHQKYKPRKTFPQLPYAHLKNPKYLQTAKGKLLIDGWWAYLRKPNYSADMVHLSTWALCAGFGSPIPYWLPCFFLIMLIHRCGRDFDRCARKYGKDWDEYCRIVPYSFIPGVY